MCVVYMCHSYVWLDVFVCICDMMYLSDWLIRMSHSFICHTHLYITLIHISRKYEQSAIGGTNGISNHAFIIYTHSHVILTHHATRIRTEFDRGCEWLVGWLIPMLHSFVCHTHSYVKLIQYDSHSHVTHTRTERDRGHERHVGWQWQASARRNQESPPWAALLGYKCDSLAEIYVFLRISLWDFCEI